VEKGDRGWLESLVRRVTAELEQRAATRCTD
jgi:hypothetical protein